MNDEARGVLVFVSNQYITIFEDTIYSRTGIKVCAAAHADAGAASFEGPHGSDTPQGRTMVVSTRPDRQIDHSHPCLTQHDHKHEFWPGTTTLPYNVISHSFEDEYTCTPGCSGPT
jgi:hypothetical protein